MNWWAFLRDHGQRPAQWQHLFTSAYWSQLNRERTATPQRMTRALPCGEVTETTFTAVDGTVVRQDARVVVSRHAVPR